MTGAEGWTVVVPVGDVPEGKPIRASVDGFDLLVYRSADAVYVTSDRCTHQGAPLSKGMVRAIGSRPVVTCPAHGSMFQLTDGRVLRPPATTPLPVYEARMNDDRIEAKLGSS